MSKSKKKPIKEQQLICLQGLVQGIGFRPFVYRLAKQYQQQGYVANTPSGVNIVIQGLPEQQKHFLEDLQTKHPSLADIQKLFIETQACSDFKGFHIQRSQTEGQASAFILPDISPCPDCIKELFNPNSRFYRYPFISCSLCGPRYSIMRQRTYDRNHTSMANFPPCPNCLKEYQNPENRRFHAQTIACEKCGPQLSLYTTEQTTLYKEQALQKAIQQLHQGKIVAIKGVGGFQLLVDASNSAAVERLRIKKQRPEKPFALLVENLKGVQKIAHTSIQTEKILTSYASPIVLLPSKNSKIIANSITKNNGLLGIMLPSSPLHQLISYGFGKPLVATSGNRSQEPLCYDETQALDKLSNIVDSFLIHNRAIIHPLDDSIIRPINQKNTLLRRARGYTPLPIALKESTTPILATGGQMKNTLAISLNSQVILSQHIGDLNSIANQQHRQQVETNLLQFYDIQPAKIICDLHPDYHSTQRALQSSLPIQAVQHHQAHIFSCMAEHQLSPPVFGFAWDGTGLGTDQQLWGGECLAINKNEIQRTAYFQPFPLVGGDKAAQEPRRSALGLLYALQDDQLFTSDNSNLLQNFSETELYLLRQSLNKKLNAPLSSSVGRLFDGIACLLNLCPVNQYEGQAALLLEQAAHQANSTHSYAFNIIPDKPLIIDWRPMLSAILKDIPLLSKNLIAAKFHNTLAEMLLNIAQRQNTSTIVLSGGCFQNAYLTELCSKKLESAGFSVYTHEKIPPNDGGLALGQLYAATLIG